MDNELLVKEILGKPQENEDQIESIAIERLKNFAEHPFKVEENDDMKNLMESIKEQGVLTPILVRPNGNEDYEIISGHRRVFACRKLGLDFVPCMIKELSHEEAINAMVDSNLHREKILPSEKAFAYKMKMDLLRRQGKRTDVTSSHIEPRLRSDEQIARENNESRATVQRYIRLTNLIPELLALVDEGRIALSHGAEIAGFDPIYQRIIYEVYEEYECTPNLSQVVRMRKLNERNILDRRSIMDIMLEEKANQIERLSFRIDEIQKYFPRSYTPKQMNEVIINLLDKWKRQRERERGDGSR